MLSKRFPHNPDLDEVGTPIQLTPILLPLVEMTIITRHQTSTLDPPKAPDNPTTTTTTPPGSPFDPEYLGILERFTTLSDSNASPKPTKVVLPGGEEDELDYGESPPQSPIPSPQREISPMAVDRKDTNLPEQSTIAHHGNSSVSIEQNSSEAFARIEQEFNSLGGSSWNPSLNTWQYHQGTKMIIHPPRLCRDHSCMLSVLHYYNATGDPNSGIAPAQNARAEVEQAAIDAAKRSAYITGREDQLKAAKENTDRLQGLLDERADRMVFLQSENASLLEKYNGLKVQLTQQTPEDVEFEKLKRTIAEQSLEINQLKKEIPKNVDEVNKLKEKLATFSTLAKDLHEVASTSSVKKTSSAHKLPDEGKPFAGLTTQKSVVITLDEDVDMDSKKDTAQKTETNHEPSSIKRKRSPDIINGSSSWTKVKRHESKSFLGNNQPGLSSHAKRFRSDRNVTSHPPQYNQPQQPEDSASKEVWTDYYNHPSITAPKGAAYEENGSISVLWVAIYKLLKNIGPPAPGPSATQEQLYGYRRDVNKFRRFVMLNASVPGYLYALWARNGFDHLKPIGPEYLTPLRDMDELSMSRQLRLLINTDSLMDEIHFWARSCRNNMIRLSQDYTGDYDRSPNLASLTDMWCWARDNNALERARVPADWLASNPAPAPATQSQWPSQAQQAMPSYVDGMQPPVNHYPPPAQQFYTVPQPTFNPSGPVTQLTPHLPVGGPLQFGQVLQAGGMVVPAYNAGGTGSAQLASYAYPGYSQPLYGGFPQPANQFGAHAPTAVSPTMASQTTHQYTFGQVDPSGTIIPQGMQGGHTQSSPSAGPPQSSQMSA